MIRFFVLLIWLNTAFAQTITLTIGTHTANPGDSIDIPITVTNFNNIGAVSLYISYDPSVLELFGVTDQPSGGSFTYNASASNIILGWFDSTPLNITSGKFATLQFKYKGGTSRLDFNSEYCEIAGPDGTVLNAQFINGLVSSGTVGVAEENTPASFDLLQNYPNPFNHLTRINYSIAAESYVKLSIYDLNGKEVKELLNEFQGAGVYTYTLNAEALASGFYICRLHTGSFHRSIKLTLLK